MKKNKRWKQLASLILVLLMCFQSPVTALAEEWTEGEFSAAVQESQDSFSEDEENQEEFESDETENSSLENGNQETSDPLLENSEVDAFISEEATEETDGFASKMQTEEADASETTEEIQVTVSVSKDGVFLKDKNEVPMIDRGVSLAGKKSYTMDDALRMAHDLYYPGGADAGYDYHEDENGIFDGVIYRLWGYNKKDVPYIKASLNHDCANYGSGLGRTIENGDELHFYIPQKSNLDSLAFFTEKNQTITQGSAITLRLRKVDGSGRVFSDCEGAVISVDGAKQENLVTDQNGKVTIPSLEARDTPYLITAQKLIQLSDGSAIAEISAAAAYIMVVPATGETGEYIHKITLNVKRNGQEKTIEQDLQEGIQPLVLPTELSHGNFYVGVETASELPEGSSIYAVYTNHRDETVCRVKLKDTELTYLKNTSVPNSYQAITTLKFEVWKDGNILQTVQIPIHYRDHLKSLVLYDSWRHEIPTGLKDSLEDQEMEVTVPQNTKYVELTGGANGWWSLNEDLISIEGAERLSDSQSSAFRFVPDWENYSECKVIITLKESEQLNISETTRYTLVIKPGETDYTPVLTDNRPANNYGIMQGETAKPFTVSASVLEENEGKLSYQWYVSSDATASIGDYQKITGATASSYIVETDQASYYKYYICVVSYEIKGRVYTAQSSRFCARVYPLSAELPVILKQPQDKIYVKGIPVTDDLTIEAQEADEFGVRIEYRWYRNTKNTVEGGTVIPGAQTSTYKPAANEIGTTYYYCRVRTAISGYINDLDKAVTVYSDPVYSDVVSVTVTEAPLPWEGAGTAASPYLIKNSTDLEALRDKVNKEGFFFEDVYFQLAENITLPEGWKPIGATKNGRVDLQNGANLNAFSGIFDGANHTITVPEGGLPLFGYVRNTRIRNLNIYGKKIAGYGLVNNFEGVGLSGSAVEIDNVTLKSGSATLKSGLLGANKTMNPYAGCSAAFVAEVQNCTIEAGVVIGYDREQSQIGSIAGRMQGTVKNCVSYATVYGTNYVGGIIGTRDNALGTCSVTGCKFYGTVTASGQQAGGIVGGGYDDSSAPNGAKVTINGCVSEGAITGVDKVGGILGADTYVAQAWDNCRYSLKNNSFTGTVLATGENASNIGGIIGFYDSLNRIDDISDNYYKEGCGADRGVGFVRYVDTNCTTHETTSGATYFSTENDTTDCPAVEGCGWKTGYHRTDDPLGADGKKLFTTEELGDYVASLELSGDYRTEFDIGEALDLSGMKITAYISDGTTKELSWTDLTIEGYAPNQRGEQKLKLSYEGAFVELTVTVLKKDAGTITVSFTLLGDKFHDSDKDGQRHTLHSGNLETWIKKTDYKVDGNANVLEVLKKALSENRMAYSSAKGENYISGITREGQEELAEFTNGHYSGWMYTLNGVQSQLGVKEQYLLDGDEIVFHYTDDYREEHDHIWSEEWSFDGEAHWHDCKGSYGTCDITDNRQKESYRKHTYAEGKVEKAATCKEEGRAVYTCITCGYMKTEVIPKAEHSYGNGKVTEPATYTKTGKMVYTCTLCGAQKTETIPVLPHTHSFTWKTVSGATISAPEKQKGTCSICGAEQTRDYGTKLKATIKLNVKSITLQKKQTTTKVKVTMAKGDSIKSWKSSNRKVVTVEKNGKIKAGKKTGTAKLTVTLKSGKKATLKVKVQSAKVKTTKLAGLKTKLTVKKGKSLALKPVVTPITSQERVTYTSSNKKVATVTKAGVIKGKKKGTATITVKSGKVMKRIKVTVR